MVCDPILESVYSSHLKGEEGNVFTGVCLLKGEGYPESCHWSCPSPVLGPVWKGTSWSSRDILNDRGTPSQDKDPSRVPPGHV